MVRAKVRETPCRIRSWYARSSAMGADAGIMGEQTGDWAGARVTVVRRTFPAGPGPW